ncbi:class I SAM-dependent methyltransferase [Asticcacaulis tiandongensis]|uniref:class I SAM-dependent methyltransferase n=1 Tax=Asticcacaulis tiandongensis TaxID=2565365 RepID=UPI00112E6D14|nr:50S ribosomal protein L11 methyltransferase [Asticcacaulis tiandongensis]
MRADRRETFIRHHTEALPVPALADIRLYQAHEVTGLWQMTEAELEAHNLPPPFWAFAWAGGQGLGLYIQDHPHIVRGKRVLDLACGSGLVGIVAAKCGAAEVTVNDIDPFTEAACALNAELNGVTLRFDGSDRLSDDIPEVDVILAGDIFYEKGMSSAMLTFLRRAHDKHIAIFLGDPHRSYLPREGLRREAHYEVATQTTIEDSPTKTVSIWSLI